MAKLVDAIKSYFGRRASLSTYLANSPAMQLPWIGYRIFKWLLAVLSVLLIVMIVYAALTYPTAAVIQGTVGEQASAQDRTAATEALRSAWLTSIKDLGQMFVLTPLFPLIGAVIGYIFGVSRQESTADASARKRDEDQQRKAAEGTPAGQEGGKGTPEVA